MKRKDQLDPPTMREIGQFLEREASRTRDAIRNVLTRRSTNEAGRSSDLLVWATETLEDEIQVDIVERRNRQVAEIEAALERLGKKEYGVCRDCGEFIGLARLKALPSTQRCQPCQARAEALGADRAMEPVGAIAAWNDTEAGDTEA